MGEWNEERIGGVNGVLEAGILDPTNRKMPDGLRYHMIDIYVDEILKVCKVEQRPKAEEEDEDSDDEDNNDDEEKDPEVEEYDITPSQLNLLLEPFGKLKIGSPSKAVKKAVGEMLEDDRVARILRG